MNWERLEVLLLINLSYPQNSNIFFLLAIIFCLFHYEILRSHTKSIWPHCRHPLFKLSGDRLWISGVGKKNTRRSYGKEIKWGALYVTLFKIWIIVLFWYPKSQGLYAVDLRQIFSSSKKYTCVKGRQNEYFASLFSRWGNRPFASPVSTPLLLFSSCKLMNLIYRFFNIR